MTKDKVLKELYDQCEYNAAVVRICTPKEDCDYCYINHAISFIEEEE